MGIEEAPGIAVAPIDHPMKWEGSMDCGRRACSVRPFGESVGRRSGVVLRRPGLSVRRGRQ
jgi:hypothetical protein